MNLYNIIFSHHAPKGSAEGFKYLLLANNDEEVYDYLSEYTIYWDNEAEIEIWDDVTHELKTTTKKEYLISIKGDYNDEGYDFSDAYYGITLHGWELLKENVNKCDYKELIEFGIIRTV